jgi:hypothetical protein
MRNDVLLLNGGGGQVHGRGWYQQCMEKAAWRTSVDSVLRGIQVFAWSRNSLERQPRLTLGPCCNTDRQTDRNSLERQPRLTLGPCCITDRQTEKKGNRVAGATTFLGGHSVF